MPEILGVACVGTSSIMEIIVDSLHKTDGLEPRMIFSRNLERGAEFARKVSVPQACDNYREMLACPDIHIVYIASPNYIHAQQAVAAMDAGKHVIVEKPLCVTAEEYNRMHEAALRNDVFFFEATTTVWMPNYLKMKALLPCLGKITEAVFVHGQYSSKYDAYLRGENPNIFNPDMKAGALNDMGIYCIRAAVDLFGAPDAIDYKALYGSNGIDLEGELRLKYGDLSVRILASKNRSPDLPNGCRITGENGLFCQDGMIHEFSNCNAHIDGQTVIIDEQPSVNRMLYEHRIFRDCILDGNHALFESTAIQSLICAQIIEAAHKNDAVGR